MSCYRCALNRNNETMIHVFGETYLLCPKCFEEYEKLPTGQPFFDFMSVRDNPIIEKIREARERREMGKGYWK